jgi:hypothetical protein
MLDFKVGKHVQVHWECPQWLVNGLASTGKCFGNIQGTTKARNGCDEVVGACGVEQRGNSRNTAIFLANQMGADVFEFNLGRW